MNKVSLIVPVYNEAAQLEAVVENLMRAPCPIEREWIFVDDRSTDGSWEILESLARRHPIRLFRQAFNQGKGAAVRRGFAEATGNYLMVQDADFEYDPSEIPSLLEPLLRGQADAVYGSRFKKNAPQVHRTYHYFVNRFLTILSNLMSGIYLTDMETCYKVFRADLVHAMRLQSSRFGIEIELTAYLAKVRARVYELPISYFPRTRWEGKKIGWKDGIAALFHLVRFNVMVSRAEAFPVVPARYSDKASFLPPPMIERDV